MAQSRMSEKDFTRWRDRLAYAKNVWIERGLIGSSRPSSMRMLIEFYRGNMWQHLGAWAGLGDDDLMVVNKIFPIANSIDGSVASRRPQVTVRARNEESGQMARPVQHLANHDLEVMGWKRQTNRVMRDHLFAPAGILQHGFTPQDEYEAVANPEGRKRSRRIQRFRPAMPDRPFVRRQPIWNCLMDPSCTFFHPDEGMRWVAFRSIEMLDDIKANPNMIEREDLAGFAGNIDPVWSGMQGKRKSDDPDQDQYVEVYTVYESVERTWFQMTLDGPEKPLRNPDDWPLPWSTLPVSIFSVNEQMDDPFPVSIMESMIPVQVELNKLRTIMHRLALKMRRLVVVNKSMDETEKEKIEYSALLELIEADGDPNAAVAQIGLGGFPQELLLYEEVLQEDLREQGGQSKMGRGQRINVESATEAAQVQQGQDVHTSRVLDAYEDFNLDAVRLYMEGRRATMQLTGPEIVPVVGEVDADSMLQWIEVTPAALDGAYEFMIEIGSTSRFSNDNEAQKRGADLNTALQSGDLLKAAYYARKYVEARGDDPSQAMNPNALTASYVRAIDTLIQNARQPDQGTQSPTGGPDANALAALGGGDGGIQSGEGFPQ